VPIPAPEQFQRSISMKANTKQSIDTTKLASVTTALASLVDAGSAMTVKGKWATWPCSKTWAEVGDEVKALKAAGFKSLFYRGKTIGIRAEHAGLPV
jgi:hypothetical protein